MEIGGGGKAVKATNSVRPGLLEQRGKSGAEGIAVLNFASLPFTMTATLITTVYLGTFPSVRRLIRLNCRSGWWVRAQLFQHAPPRGAEGIRSFSSHVHPAFEKELRRRTLDFLALINSRGHADQRAPAKHTYCLIGIVGLRVIAPKTSLGKPCRLVSLHAPKSPVVYKYITGCRRHADDLRSSTQHRAPLHSMHSSVFSARFFRRPRQLRQSSS